MQCQFSLWVTQWERWYFMSYCPEMPEIPMLVTVEPDPTIQAALNEHIPRFVTEFEAEKARLLEAGATPREPVSDREPMDA